MTSLTGGAARRSFALDDGGLVVGPPRRGARPVVTRRTALCDAMASSDFTGASLSADAGEGVAVGYADVSVAPSVARVPYGLGFVDTTPGDHAATIPPLATYRDRLVWLVVVRHVTAASCPVERAPVTTTTAPPGVHDDFYELFLVDARTGASAAVYDEGGPSPCGSGPRRAPALGPPLEGVSVPWTLVARDPDGYAGTVDAAIAPCEGHPGTVLVEQSAPVLQVAVTRAVGVACGVAVEVPLTVHAATVFADLPATILHAPIGLLTAPGGGATAAPTPPARPTTPTTAGTFQSLTVADDGTTVTVPVGTVLTVGPSPVPHELGPVLLAVASSDPSVASALGGPEAVAEVRAWRPGTTVLSLAAGLCGPSASGSATCVAPWRVTLVVT